VFNGQEEVLVSPDGAGYRSVCLFRVRELVSAAEPLGRGGTGEPREKECLRVCVFLLSSYITD